jgi:hypothetical protein
MDWIRGIFSNVEFSCSGALVRLANENDNYAKKTEFLSATLVLKKKELFIRNNDFDPDQDQIEFISFPLSQEASLTHYSIEDDGTRIECIKWTNLSKPSQFYAFEFEDPSNLPLFLSQVSSSIKPEEEGHQSEDSVKSNPKSSIETLKASSLVAPSKIDKVQSKPEVEDSEEDCKSRVQFKRDAIAYLSPLYSPDMILFMSAADLFMLGPNLSSPVCTDPGIAFLLIRNSDFNVTMDLVRDQMVFMRILINNRFYCYVDTEGQKFSWVEEVSENESRTWRVDLKEDVGMLESLINVCRYESDQKVKVSDLVEEDQNWIKNIPEESKLNPMQVDFEAPLPLKDDSEETIFDTVSSWRNSKVFAGRKGKISIFSESSLKPSSTITLPRQVRKMLLQDQDTSLICLSNDSPNIVYNVDIEKGQIIQEFSLKDKEFLHLCHISKLSPLTPSTSFLGLSYNGIFLIDPREAKQVVQEFVYSSSGSFSCIATTEQGHIAVGSETGEVKLYREIGEKAKTVFHDLGESIKSLDTTKDGKWILATSSSCLLILKAEYDGELAFNKPLAKKKKPARRLVLNPEDLARFNISKVDFAPARFNISENDEESVIITATGNVVVLWNFLSVKAGKLFDYFIQPLEQQVVKNEFIFNEEKAVITYPSSVVIQNSRWKGRS